MIYEWSNSEKDDDGELLLLKKEIYILREVLKYLIIENIRDCKIFFKSIKSEYEKNKMNIENDVIINLCEYLIECVQRDALPLFKLLEEKYSKIFKIDPNFGNVYIYCILYIV